MNLRLLLLVLALLGLPKTSWGQASLEDVSSDVTEQPVPPGDPNDPSVLDEEFEPPKEAPYTTETDPVTAEPVLVKKETPPPVNENAPVTYELQSPESQPTSTQFKQSGLKKISAKGEYLYHVEPSEQVFGVSFRGGMFAPPALSNKLENNQEIKFKDIYGGNSNSMFLLDVEWQFLRGAGIWAIKGGTGYYSANGNGRFKRDASMEAREEFTFHLIPNSLELVFRMQFWERQPFVPYAFAGGSYFAFIETRDDGKAPKYGGAMTANFGGGAAIMLDSIDRQSVNQLDKDYGINHVWLIGEYRYFAGMSTKFDFTNDLLTGGILVEF